MKIYAAALAVCTLALPAQEYPAGQLKNLPIAAANGAPLFTVAALEIQRAALYPAVIHLKGSVEIRMPVCVRTDPENVQVCQGYTVLRADEADVHEDTGQIDARGNVKVTHEERRPQ